jgi:hypothetical protein
VVVASADLVEHFEENATEPAVGNLLVHLKEAGAPIATDKPAFLAAGGAELNATEIRGVLNSGSHDQECGSFELSNRRHEGGPVFLSDHIERGVDVDQLLHARICEPHPLGPLGRFILPNADRPGHAQSIGSGDTSDNRVMRGEGDSAFAAVAGDVDGAVVGYRATLAAMARTSRSGSGVWERRRLTSRRAAAISDS